MCASAPSMPAPIVIPPPPPPPPPVPPAQPSAQEVLPSSGKRMNTPSASTSSQRRGRSGLRIDLSTGGGGGYDAGLNMPS